MHTTMHSSIANMPNRRASEPSGEMVINASQRTRSSNHGTFGPMAERTRVASSTVLRVWSAKIAISTASPDAISGARPGARRETLEKYVKRLEQLESIATSLKGVQQAFAIQAGREVRVIVDPAQVDDTNCNFIARDIAKRVSEEMTFPGEIRVTVLREMRTVEYAR